MTLGIPHNQRLPLAIAALALLFLSVFLLYPLANVFGASVLDAEGETFTLANYTKMLGRPFYRTAILNTLSIGVAATTLTTLLDQTLTHAASSLTLAHQIRASLRPPETPWRLLSTSRFNDSKT